MNPHSVAREHGFLAFENLENQASYLFWPGFLNQEFDLRQFGDELALKYLQIYVLCSTFPK